ncbi:endonuclease/exonuclease/phosphatase family protein [Streptomyces sp. NPDC012508]|uniref:endonuclease/exonuclease/phosphatase family protein n=1 Tax=Streptomyces sp. NPDC012508 TaxID=3364837 RepID=UPI0036C5B72C
MIRRRELLGMVGATAGAGLLGAGTAEATPRSGGRVPSYRTLKVLQFNIWLGGSQVPGGRAGIADTIAAVEPDVVMLSESTPERVATTLADLADRGLTYYDNENPTDPAVISRYPVIEHQSFPYWS